MPSGSCYCGQAKIFYDGEPMRQVRPSLVKHDSHDTLSEMKRLSYIKI